MVLKTYKVRYGYRFRIHHFIMSYGPLSIVDFHVNPHSAMDFWNGDLSAPVRIVQVLDQNSFDPDLEFWLSDTDRDPGFFVTKIGNITVEKMHFFLQPPRKNIQRQYF
jgi:hypothetical protein